jgi:hypothetical protein
MRKSKLNSRVISKKVIPKLTVLQRAEEFKKVFVGRGRRI